MRLLISTKTIFMAEATCWSAARGDQADDAIAAAFQMAGWISRGTTFAEGTIFAAFTIDGQRVSFAVVEPSGYLVLVFTLLSFRRQGYARQLISDIRRHLDVVAGNAVSAAGAEFMEATGIQNHRHLLCDTYSAPI